MVTEPNIANSYGDYRVSAQYSGMNVIYLYQY